MEFWERMVTLAASLLVSLISLQTALLNAKIARMKVKEAKTEKEKAAPVDAGSDR